MTRSFQRVDCCHRPRINGDSANFDGDSQGGIEAGALVTVGSAVTIRHTAGRTGDSRKHE